MPYNMIKRIKSIYKNSFLELSSFSFIFLMFAFGLFSAGISVIGNSHGIVRIFLVLSVTFVCEIALAPIIIGAYKWIHGLQMGEIRPMKNAFSEFSDLISIYDSQKALLTCMFCARIALTPLSLTLFIVSKFPLSHTGILLIILALSASLRLLCGIFPLMHILLNAPHVSLLKAVSLSFRCMKKRGGEFFRLILTYLLLGAMSFASFGVLFIFTIPYVLCSMVVYCDTVFEEHQLYKHNLFY